MIKLTAIVKRVPTKKALLIGINTFKFLDNRLYGCINDTENMKDLLIRTFDFGKNNIHNLTDALATRNTILKEIQWLIRDVEKGDILVLHCSSYGTKIFKEDEVICCYDMDWKSVKKDEGGKRGHIIVKDDLAPLMKKIEGGVKVEVFFDVCFSGTNPPTLSEQQIQKKRPIIGRYLTPPKYYSGGTEVGRRDEEDPSTSLGSLTWFGAKKGGQTGFEAFLGGKYNGVFTYNFCQDVRSVRGKIIVF